MFGQGRGLFLLMNTRPYDRQGPDLPVVPEKYLLYADGAKLDKPIKPADFNCSAHPSSKLGRRDQCLIESVQRSVLIMSSENRLLCNQKVAAEVKRE